MKKIILIGLASLLLAGCTSDGTPSGRNRLTTIEQQLPDGRTVTCIVREYYNPVTDAWFVANDSLSCDWNNEKMIDGEQQ